MTVPAALRAGLLLAVAAYPTLVENHPDRLTTPHPIAGNDRGSELVEHTLATRIREASVVSMMFETEGAPRIDIRAEALINDAFLRVIHTGSREQIVVMALPPDAEIGDEVHPHTDQLFVVVEGNGEARVGPYELGVEAGDLVFVEAGTRHNIINRATIPLRLITVLAPPAYQPGTIARTMEVRELPAAAPWRPFP